MLTSIITLTLVITLHFPGAVFLPNENSFSSPPSIPSNSQRCADQIFFFFNDQDGKNIDPASFQSITIVRGERLGEKRHAEKKGMKGFSVGTHCGYREMKVTIGYQDTEMELIFKQVPGDQGNVFLYSIPFSEGTYEFDFENSLDKTCEDNVKGWHGECVISPKRLKKAATPDLQ